GAVVRRSSRHLTGTRDASHSSVVQPCSVRPGAIAGVTDRYRRGDPASRVGALALGTVRASSCAVPQHGQTPTTTTVGSRTTSGPWRTPSCAVWSADDSAAGSGYLVRQSWW